LNKEIEQVLSFHRRIGAPVSARPALLACAAQTAHQLSLDMRKLLIVCQEMSQESGDLPARVSLALEELAEWVEAHAAGDMEAAADAWGDRMYVLLGDAVAAGLPATEIFGEIHQSNMSKVAPERGGVGKGKKTDAFMAPRFGQILRQAACTQTTEDGSLDAGKESD
jgi:predicted HAD superfamily Cof-like phosphohydrolase